MSKSTVLVVDDHPILRHGIAELIDREPDLQVTGEADSAEQAMALLAGHRFDLVIIDISLLGLSGIELLKSVRLRHPDLQALVLSMHDELLYAERALRAGARGYLMKQEATKHIVAALRRIVAGELYLSERFQARMLERMVERPRADAAASPLSLLSDRELEVFRLIGQGMKSGEIAAALNRSINTIDAHRANIKKKIGARSSAELSRAAYQAFADVR